MRRLVRSAAAALLLLAMLLLSGCGYILVEDPSAATSVGSPTYKLPTPQPESPAE